MEKAVIYVAGCPDAYPVEFYNAETGAYEGVIPQLLRRFSQQSDYEVRYYAPGRRDQRQRLARNRQVDMVTCLDGETFPNRRGEAVAAVTAEVDGAPAAYRLCLLDVAPKGLEQALQSFMAQVSEEVRRFFPEKVFSSVIPRNIRLSEAPSHGLPVLAYDKQSKGAESYYKLAAEILKKEGI